MSGQAVVQTSAFPQKRPDYWVAIKCMVSLEAVMYRPSKKFSFTIEEGDWSASRPNGAGTDNPEELQGSVASHRW